MSNHALIPREEMIPGESLSPLPGSLVPSSFEEMRQLAAAVAASKMFGMQTPEQALVLMALCRSEGKDPIQAVRQYHIINGRPALRADAMLAEFQARGGVVSWEERTNERVSARFRHSAGGEVLVTWTLEDAKRAGLTGNPTWAKFPRQMLTARVISEGVRTVLPGVVAGIYTPEEVESFTPAAIEEAPTGRMEGRGQEQVPPAPERNWLKARPGTASQESPFGPDQPLPTRQGPPATAPSRRRNPLEEAADAFVDLAEGLGYEVRASDGRPSKRHLLELLSQVRGEALSSLPASAGDWATAYQELTDWHSQQPQAQMPTDEGEG